MILAEKILDIFLQFRDHFFRYLHEYAFCRSISAPYGITGAGSGGDSGLVVSARNIKHTKSCKREKMR